MSTLTQDQMNRAKEKASKYLVDSITRICITLAIDPADVSGDMEIPVSDDDDTYRIYASLIRQVQALEKL
jgi:hypothetical protein